MTGIKDIYNIVTKSAPQEAIEESVYDTLEDVVKSIRTGNHQAGFSMPLTSPGSDDTAEEFRHDNSISPEPPQHPIPPGLQSSTVSMPLLFFF